MPSLPGTGTGSTSWMPRESLTVPSIRRSRRLTAAGLLESRWEDRAHATASNRPPRKYYRLTSEGTLAHAEALNRLPGIAHTFGAPEPDAPS